MDLNRNHFFCAGLVFLLLGAECYYVDSLILTPDATRILANAQAAAKRNVRLFTFGVGYDVNTVLLDSLAQGMRGAIRANAQFGSTRYRAKRAHSSNDRYRFSDPHART